jgi:hypothetical protein
MPRAIRSSDCPDSPSGYLGFVLEFVMGLIGFEHHMNRRNSGSIGFVFDPHFWPFFELIPSRIC